VSAEFQTSRSEASHWRSMCKKQLLDSYRYNRPSSAKISFTITIIERIKGFKQQSYKKYSKLGIMALRRCIWFCIDFKRLRKFPNAIIWLVLLCVHRFVRPHGTTMAPTGQMIWKFILRYFSKILWEYLLTINVLDKSCTDNQHTCFILNNFFFNLH